MSRFVFFIFVIAVGYFGYSLGSKPKAAAPLFSEKEFPLTENKKFAVVVYAHNDGAWIKEKVLESLFAQDYENFRLIFIDDASADQTYEEAQAYILGKKEESRSILIRNETYLGKASSIYRVLDSLSDKEIVVLLDARQWFSHPFALTRINSAYQNPDVWTVVSSGIDYPSYDRVEPLTIGSQKGEGAPLPLAFYATIFKEIGLIDLLDDEKNSFYYPILMMSGEKVSSIQDPLFFHSSVFPRVEKIAPPIAPYTPLKEFPKPITVKKGADILLFSFDRPLQLYACLESIEHFLTGFEAVTVIYRASGQRYLEGYEEVKGRFAFAEFIQQSNERPKKDFKPLVLKALFNAPSEFILFGVDDMIVKDFADLTFCIEMMEKTKAYGFYLRFGKHISFCYQNKLPQNLPKSLPLAENVYAWDLDEGEHDWNFPNSIDMTLFRKKDLKEAFEKMKFKTPNSLEFIWASEYRPKRALGLYFERSKAVNLPLNVVSHTGNPHMDYKTTEELLTHFEEGLKIDIAPLYQVENSSPHFAYEPKWIVR